MEYRTGLGVDVHPLVPDRSLILGGVTIPFGKGLRGHSDGDALCHAIADALLGAANMGDIGQYYPSSNEEYKDMASIEMLKSIYQTISGEGYTIINVDTVVLVQEPKLSTHVPRMRKAVATAISVNAEQVSIKASTTDYLGFIGQGDGLAVFATVLISI